MVRTRPKQAMVGIRADLTSIAAWKRRARNARMSFNKWATLILDSAPDVAPATIKERSK